MKKSRFTETQIVSILKEADSGIKVSDLCRQQWGDLTNPTYSIQGQFVELRTYKNQTAEPTASTAGFEKRIGITSPLLVSSSTNATRTTRDPTTPTPPMAKFSPKPQLEKSAQAPASKRPTTTTAQVASPTSPTTTAAPPTLVSTTTASAKKLPSAMS
jgi:putative transposase